MKIKDGILHLLFLMWACFGMSGCEPISPEDKAFFLEQDRARGEKLATMRSANARVSGEEIIRRVQEYPAHEGTKTMKEWVGDDIFRIGGEVIFPKWTTRRGGSNIQEVMYEFMLLGSDGKMTRYQYSWEVDVLNMTVQPPKLTKFEEYESSDETMYNQHLRRVKQHEQELR